MLFFVLLSLTHFNIYAFKIPPSCTSLTNPSNNAIDVPMDAAISWMAVNDAAGYIVNIGLTSGGGEIFSQDVGNVTTLNLPTDLPEASLIFVTIVPYNASLEYAQGCKSESFTTETVVTKPSCTRLITPLNGAINVPVDVNFSWETVLDADGYTFYLGTSSSAYDIVDGVDVGAETNYALDVNLPDNTTLFIKIVAYNIAGNAVGCFNETFSTEEVLELPVCATLITPIQGANDVPVTTSVEWNAVPNTDGYYLEIGTSNETNDILPKTDVGLVTIYNPLTHFPENSDIFIKITPYNSNGEAAACQVYSFTTENSIDLPLCTNLINPINEATEVAVTSVIEWEDIPNAVGYGVQLGLTPGGSEVLSFIQLGNTTQYIHPEPFPYNTTIYLSIIPYNEDGEAEACTEFSFFKNKFKF